MFWYSFSMNYIHKEGTSLLMTKEGFDMMQDDIYIRNVLSEGIILHKSPDNLGGLTIMGIPESGSQRITDTYRC